MAELLLLFLSHGICVFVSTFAMFVVGRVFHFRIEEASLFSGRALLRFEVRGTTYRLNWLPLGGSVKFGADYEAAPLFKKLPLILSGCGALFFLAAACLPFDEAMRSLTSGFEQIILGAVQPYSHGCDYVRLVSDFLKSHSFVAILGATAAKECAFNLLPFPPLSGGYAILAIADSLFSLSEKAHFRIVLIGLLLVFAILLGWIIAVLATGSSSITAPV